MDDRIDNWGGQELSLAEAAKLLNGLPEEGDLLAEDPVKREAIVAAQQRSEKMAEVLSTGVNKLHDKLKAAKSAGEVFTHLDFFYSKLPTFMSHFGLSTESSDAMKLLYGIYEEYRNMFAAQTVTEEEIMKSKKFEQLNSFFVNFASALRNVSYYKDWNTIEQSVGELVRVVGVEESEMSDLNYELEFHDPKDRNAGRDLIEKAGMLDQKPVSAVMDKFAAGETSLEEMERLAEIWNRVKAKVEDILIVDPNETN
jgi:hypothetical protein